MVHGMRRIQCTKSTRIESGISLVVLTRLIAIIVFSIFHLLNQYTILQNLRRNQIKTDKYAIISVLRVTSQYILHL